MSTQSTPIERFGAPAPFPDLGIVAAYPMSILEDGIDSLPGEQELREADPDERRMIRAILNMEEISARDIMGPRVDIIAVEDNVSVEDIITLMSDCGHSRIVVYRGTIDNIIGIVHARDVLKSMISTNEKIRLSDIARPALFIPENKSLDEPVSYTHLTLPTNREV